MKQKKRWLSLILAVLLVVGLLPVNAMAADRNSSIRLGTGVMKTDSNTENAATVYFGKDNADNAGKWRVIGYNGSGAASESGKMTLLAANNMGITIFSENNNEYSVSALKTAIDNLVGKLTDKEKASVSTRTLSSGKYDFKNTDCIAGAEVREAVFWPLSTKEANAVNNRLCQVNDLWWLRSPGYRDYGVASVEGNGNVHDYGYSVILIFGVRPAFNLNLDSVLFTSAAEGGKSSDANGGGNQDGEAVGGIFETKEYAGTEWKLTLKDDSRNNFSVLTTDTKDKNMTLAYMGATTGSNEYVSALITDVNGTITHYGRLKNLNDETMKNGTVEVTLPDDFDSDTDKLYVFSEQYNGDKMTDYASALKEVSLIKNAYKVTNMLNNVTSANGTELFAVVGNDYTDTFTTTGVYRVPDEINVRVGNVDLADTDYTYTPADNKMSATLKISSDKITGDIEISVTATEAKQETPTAVFNATSDTGGNLTGVDDTMSYSLDGGANWTKITADILVEGSIGISNVTVQNGIQIRKDGNDTASASEVQKITVTQASAPTGLGKTDCTTLEQNNGTITGVNDTMEYRLSTEESWTSVTGTTILNLSNGDYDIRVKADGTRLASPYTTVMIEAHSCSAASDDYHKNSTHHWKVCACGNEVEKEAHSGGTPIYFQQAVCADCNTAYGEVVSDTTCPTGEISIKENKWTSFLNQITFGKFFKDTQDVTITGTDDSETVEGYDAEKHAVKVAYYLYSGDKALTEEELKATTFTDYAEAFKINPDNKYVVYARITDHAGNVTYISSDGLVLDATAPVINGLEDDKTYCIEKTFTVDEAYIKEVRDNETVITSNEKGEYTLTAGTHRITVTDKAGNEAVSVTVTVNESHIPKADDGDCTTAITCSVCGDTTTAAQNHSFTDYKSNGDATCTVDGTKTAKCNNAGCKVTDTQTDVGSAPGHDLGEWQTITSPNCTDKGSEKRTCSKCNYFETKDVEPNGHEWETEFTVDKAATCTEDGSKSIHCKNCEAAKDSTVIAALGHNYGEPEWNWAEDHKSASATFTCERTGCTDGQEGHVVTETAAVTSEVKTPASCTEEGTTIYTATVTFHNRSYTDTKEAEDIVELGHDLGEWKTITSPNCTDKGSEKRTCFRCDYFETKDVEPNGHEWETEFTVDKAATCTEDGSKSIHCKNCEAAKDSTVIAALGHNYGEPEWNWAEDHKSASATFTCERTGCTDGQEGHVVTETAAVTSEVKTPASCTEEGTTIYTATVTFHNRSYTDTKEAEDIVELGHDLGEWKTITSPNCTDKGSEKRTCSRCDYFETKDIEPNGHEWEMEFTVDKEATCTEDGSKSIHCKNCEAAKDSTVIAALGHNFKDGVCTVCKEADPSYKGHSTTDDSTWNKGDNDGAVIKVPSDIGDVTEVTIDDKEVTEGKDYTVENGKVIIHPDVLEKLDEGKHTVLIRGENGSVEATLTVAKKADKTNPNIPKTGDNASTTLWCVLMLMSGFVLTGVFVYRRKHKRTNG